MKYGPQTHQIEKVLERLSNLTFEQKQSLGALWITWDVDYSIDRAARHSARAVTEDANRYDALLLAAEIVSDTVMSVDSTTESNASSNAAVDAVMALLVRDLIGEEFTQEHYDLLVEPWIKIVGEFEEQTTDRLPDEVIVRNIVWTGAGRPTDEDIGEFVASFNTINKDVLEQLAKGPEW